jgi:hypothetical protein
VEKEGEEKEVIKILRFNFLLISLLITKFKKRFIISKLKNNFCFIVVVVV